jgi:hypothetical protein
MSQDMCVNCGAVCNWTEEPTALVLMTPSGGCYYFCGICKTEECVALDEDAPYVAPISLVEESGDMVWGETC